MVRQTLQDHVSQSRRCVGVWYVFHLRHRQGLKLPCRVPRGVDRPRKYAFDVGSSTEDSTKGEVEAYEEADAADAAGCAAAGVAEAAADAAGCAAAGVAAAETPQNRHLPGLG